MPTMHMTKVPEYPRPHRQEIQFGIPVESAGIRHSTIVPICTYDEGLGAMSAYKSNPVNASYVEANTSHCFPTSRINKIFCKLDVSMSKIMLETDKIHAIKFATATIHTAFSDGSDAKDEVSTLSLDEVLELQSETTDRQTYPLYNAIDLNDYKANSRLDMSAEQLGLDTDLEIEGVTFSTNVYYDCLQQHTTASKLRTICTPLKWHMLTRQHPVKTIFFQQQSNTKFMNPFTLLAAFIHVPQMASTEQIGAVGDTTIETCQLNFNWMFRYLEFNHEFNHSML